MAIGHGEWKNGEWVVVVSRPLKRENGSVLQTAKDAFIAFAIWQGGKDEVGSRKSLTMSWVPLKILGKGDSNAK
jgi:DMSO reductase family type II enzyme heme b subunit